MVNLLIIANSLEFIGTIMIGIAVLLTHIHLGKEHQIDDVVLKDIRHEVWLSLIGMILIVAGFIMNLYQLV
jgi:hypothetical protein